MEPQTTTASTVLCLAVFFTLATSVLTLTTLGSKKPQPIEATEDHRRINHKLEWRATNVQGTVTVTKTEDGKNTTWLIVQNLTAGDLLWSKLLSDGEARKEYAKNNGIETNIVQRKRRSPQGPEGGPSGRPQKPQDESMGTRVGKAMRSFWDHVKKGVKDFLTALGVPTKGSRKNGTRKTRPQDTEEMEPEKRLHSGLV